MESNNAANSAGIGLCSWMFLLFLGLKLTGYITWSWWWVTAPLWGPAVIVLGILGIVLVLGKIFDWF